MNLADIPKKYHRYRIVFLLIGIFLLGFSIRYLARGPRIGPELDTWFHYRMVNYILDLGFIPEIDPLAYYPTGRPVWRLDLLGLPFFIAYTYKLVSFTGITLMDYMIAFPAIFTSLAAVPLYLLAKELLDERTGLLTALLWQIIPSTLTRTHAGFVDKETLASVYIFLWLWLLIKSIKSVDPNKRRTLAFPVLSGFFMGLSEWTWGGSEYFILVISTSILLYTLINFQNIQLSIGYSIILMTVFGLLTMKIVQSPRFPLNLFYTHFIYISLLGLCLVYGIIILHSYLRAKIGGKNSKYAIGTSLFLILSGTVYSGFLQMFVRKIFIFVNNRIRLEKGLVAATVSENLSPSFPGDWLSHFTIILYIFPIGLFLLVYRFKQRRDYFSLFLLVLALSGILGMRSDIRLSFALTPSFAMIIAYSIFYFVNYFQKKEMDSEHTLANSKKHKMRYKAETQRSNAKMARLLVIITLFGIVAAPTVTSFSMLNGRKVDVPVPWYRAMIWLRDNTPENSVIVSWWDYGYWEQALAKRITVVDGGNGGPLVFNTNYTEGLEYRGSTQHRDVDMAKMFTSPEDEALKYLRPYVDYENVPTYVLASYEEFGKSSAINHISQDGGLYIFPQTFPKSGNEEQDNQVINDFINNNRIEALTIVNFGNYWQMWFTGFDPNKGPDSEMKNKLLPKLLPFQNTGFGQGLKHFELVYQDEWNYVLIYKVV
jgi:dolichyl-diphosphooligosaccharide--protein glycosyltransferase